jgi:dipeptidyl aminopeptidase/acylaminoacyl peptidase
MRFRWAGILLPVVGGLCAFGLGALPAVTLGADGLAYSGALSSANLGAAENGVLHIATLDDHPDCRSDFCDEVYTSWFGTGESAFRRLREYLPTFEPVVSPDGAQVLYAEPTRYAGDGTPAEAALVVSSVDWTLGALTGQPRTVMTAIDLLDRQGSLPLAYAWSPDGRAVAVSSRAGHRPALWVVEPEGTRRLRTACAPRAVDTAELAWSSAGVIAFVAGYGAPLGRRRLPASAIYTVRADGTQGCRLLVRPRGQFRIDRYPAWSDDAARLTFVRAGNRDRLMAVEANRTGLRTVVRARLLAVPAWSPDGQWIAYDDVVAGPKIVPASGGRSRSLGFRSDQFVTGIEWEPAEVTGHLMGGSSRLPGSASSAETAGAGHESP